MNKWDERFLGLARHVSAWSKDPSTKVGAVIANQRNVIVSLGFNGFPRRMTDDEARLTDRALKYEMILHAEMNAILFAGDRARGTTLYTWPLPPCARCAATIIQAGIMRVVSRSPNFELKEKWGKSIDIAKAMFLNAGIPLELFMRSE